MKVVRVRHSPEQRITYSFVVPTRLEDKVYHGAEVICDTRRGSARGVIVDILNGSRDSLSAILLHNQGLILSDMRYITDVMGNKRVRRLKIADDKSITELLSE